MYAEILRRNKNDCSLPIPLLLEASSKLGMIEFLNNNSEEIAKEIIRCHKHSKGKKAVVIPLGFKNKNKESGGGSHANALLFNTLHMTAEHFEPHGLKDYSLSKKDWLQLQGVNLKLGINAVNKQLKRLAKEQGLKEFSKGLNYIRPVDVCPSNEQYKDFRGVQSVDRSKKEPVEFEGFTITEAPGYCQLWTYFLLELRLKTLNRKPDDVLKSYATYRDAMSISITSDPNYKPENYFEEMMTLIRGYSKIYFNMIKKLINEGKFTLDEFLKYRNINDYRGDKSMPDSVKNEANEIYTRLTDIISDEATKILDLVMKNTPR